MDWSAVTNNITLVMTSQWDSHSQSPSMDGLVGPDAIPRRDLTPLGLITIIILSVITNLTVCVIVKLDRRLHHMTFYFFVSLAVVHLLMSSVAMPLALFVVIAGGSMNISD